LEISQATILGAVKLPARAFNQVFTAELHKKIVKWCINSGTW